MSSMTYEENQAWLASLKPGDEVVEKSGNLDRIEKVLRITNTGRIVLYNGDQFRPTTGHKITTARYDSAWLVPVTEGIRANIAHENLVHQVWHELAKYNINEVRKLPDKRLKAFLHVLKGEVS